MFHIQQGKQATFSMGYLTGMGRDWKNHELEIEKSIDPEVLGTEGLEIGKFRLIISFLIFVFSYFRNFLL